MGEVLRHGLSGHGQHVAVQQSGVQQCLHDHRHAADAVDAGHHALAERLDVGEELEPTRVKSASESSTLASCAIAAAQVQHRVGGPAEGHHHGDGVLEGLLGEDVASSDASA